MAGINGIFVRLTLRWARGRLRFGEKGRLNFLFATCWYG